MKKTIQPQINYRLVLAKTLFASGVDLCETKVDDFNFSHGLINLHDALDNFTGAIATSLNITLPRESSLLTTINLIQDYERKNDSQFLLLNRNEIVQLNTHRNNIKHQGITPNIHQAKTLIGPIVVFFQEYSKRYFDVEWEFISLADLVKNEETRESLKEIEEMIDRGQYKESLDKMAITKFQVFDKSLLQIRLDPRFDLSPPSEETKKLRESNNIFPDTNDGWFSDLYDRTKFLERGIDRDLMKKFETLTAKVGINNANEWKHVLKHDHQWGDLNWTREIAVFCLNFLVDSIVKYQGRDYGVKQRWFFERHKIKAKEEINLYEKKQNKLVYTIKKDEEREVMVFSWVDNRWEIFNEDDRLMMVYDDDGKRETLGYFKEGDEYKIQFLEVQRFVQDENGSLKLVE